MLTLTVKSMWHKFGNRGIGGKMWRELKEILGDAMIIFFVVWMLICFGMFWVSPTGYKLMGESNRVVLSIEIVAVAIILGLGIERLIDDIRAFRKKR